MPTNDFLTFAGGAGANVLDQVTYGSLAARTSGFQSGIAQSVQLNKVWRQSSIIASMIGQFIADFSGDNAVDDGTIQQLEADFVLAIQSVTRTQVPPGPPGPGPGVGPPGPPGPPGASGGGTGGGRFTTPNGLTIFVSPSGNDANDGFSPNTALRTIAQATINMYTLYDFNHQGCTIQLAAGTYNEQISFAQMPVACTFVQVLGNLNNPSSVVINGGSTGTSFGASFGEFFIAGATLTAQNGILAGPQAFCGAVSVNYQNSGTSITVTAGSQFVSANTNMTFIGSSTNGIVCANSSIFQIEGSSVSFQNASYSVAFLETSQSSASQIANVSWSGSFQGIRFNSSLSAIIFSGGAGVNYIPGSQPGQCDNQQGLIGSNTYGAYF